MSVMDIAGNDVLSVSSTNDKACGARAVDDDDFGRGSQFLQSARLRRDHRQLISMG